MNRSLGVFVMAAALAAAGCGERRSARVPLAPSLHGVVSAAWVADRGEVERACGTAFRSPLVVRLLQGSTASRLLFDARHAAVCRGVLSDSTRVSLTILPHVAAGDSTHTVYVALGEGLAAPSARRWEVIEGRPPRPDEAGYEPIAIGGQVVWVSEEVEAAAAGAAESASVGERFNKQKFLGCMSAAADRIDKGLERSADWASAFFEGPALAVSALVCYFQSY